MFFRNGEKDLLSDTQSHPKDLNHRLPGAINPSHLALLRTI
jgi:hypothetical protein